MALVMKENKALDPVNIGIFRAQAVVTDTNRRADLVKQFWFPSFYQNRRAGKARGGICGEWVRRSDSCMPTLREWGTGHRWQSHKSPPFARRKLRKDKAKIK